MIELFLMLIAGINGTGADYGCGERSPILAEEQERIVCENQHYNITGKNKTTIGGYETYCCPSPWLPDDCCPDGINGTNGSPSEKITVKVP